MRKYLIALAMLLVASGPAATAMVTDTNPAVLNGANIQATRTLTISAPGSVLDVILELDFAKCNDRANTTGCTSDDGRSPFFYEIVFSLESPDGTVVEAIPESTWKNGTSPNFSGIITLDDSAAQLVNFNLNRPVAGTYRPMNPFTVFDGETAAGDWTLTALDRWSGEPLVYRSSTLTVVTAPSVVPIPAALPLFASALVGYGFVARRKHKAQAA